MAKVSMHLGFTFRVGRLDTNQYGRIDLSIDQIDTELPIEEQLEEAGLTADKGWDSLLPKVKEQIKPLMTSNES